MMTEQEWLTSTDPQAMLEFLRGKASDRKLRLFAAASFRRLAFLLPDSRQHLGIELMEQLAAGTATLETSGGVIRNVRLAMPPSRIGIVEAAITDDPHFIALMLYRELVSSSVAMHAVQATAGLADSAAEKAAQSCLLRDAFGNPSRCITINPAWLIPTLVKMAQTIYDHRPFDRLPVLADALENAGCHIAEILSHCRGPGPHVRGCWVVDLLLGKE